MAWISKGYIHTVYSDKVAQCSRCGQEWVPWRALRMPRCSSFTCPDCSLTAAPVYLSRPSDRGYDAVVHDCWEKYHGVVGRFVLHPDFVVECQSCGHVWRLHQGSGLAAWWMCPHCHLHGVPQYTVEAAPKLPYGWTAVRPKPNGGGNRRVPDFEILCTRCDTWVPFCAGARLVDCPTCDIPMTVRLVGDKRIRELRR